SGPRTSTTRRRRGGRRSRRRGQPAGRRSTTRARPAPRTGRSGAPTPSGRCGSPARRLATPGLALVVALVLGESARRPVRPGRIAAARAVEGSHVLERDQDVTVELDVRDVVDGTVRGEHAVLIVAVHQRDLDLLALVLARVVLHVLSLLRGGCRP